MENKDVLDNINYRKQIYAQTRALIGDYMEKIILPDGKELNKNRLKILKLGYDHYWRFHDKPEEWEKWCDICKMILIKPRPNQSSRALR